MAIEVGQTAPDFTLYDSEKQQVTLSSFRGHQVVILFFPLAFTGVCTKELCQVRDTIGNYNKLEATVLAISVDSLQTLNKFKQDHGLNFSLLSDFNKEVSTLYGTIYETFAFNMRGVSKRSAFVLDKSGVVRYAEVLENAGELPDFTAIEQRLAKLN